MSSDPNKKSPRTFQCRDMLWETFEQMARELECSVDYLINEAMKQYARQRSYGGRTPYPTRAARAAAVSAGGDRRERAASADASASACRRCAMRSARMRGELGGGLPPPPARGGGLPAPPPPPRRRDARAAWACSRPPRMARRRAAPRGRSQPPSAPRSAPPPIPGGAAAAPARCRRFPGGGGGYNGGARHAAARRSASSTRARRSAITKDRFVIGRGKQSSDLTLKDPNVSRQHAMIEYQNGVYFMVDMGSTNGVEYNGQRIARKQIAEGDVFRICDHDLRFTYR